MVFCSLSSLMPSSVLFTVLLTSLIFWFVLMRKSVSYDVYYVEVYLEPDIF